MHTEKLTTSSVPNEPKAGEKFTNLKTGDEKLRRFTYRDNSDDKKIIFQCEAKDIAEADKIYEEATGKNPEKQNHVGCSIDTENLSEKFNAFDESGTANSVITRELFRLGKLFISGGKGQEKVLKKIHEMPDGFNKDNALFRVAKLSYETNGDITAALKLADEIASQDEKNRCLIHLALEVLKKENNLTMADEIVGKVKEDGKGYSDYYKKERKKYL